MYLNPGNFPSWEWTHSQTAVRRGIQNEPDARQWAIISEMAYQINQPARDTLGPIRMSSGFRCPELNRAIGGSRFSDHQVLKKPKAPMKRVAASDLIPLAVPLRELWLYLHSSTQWARLIWEFGRWIHVSYDAEGPPRHRELFLLEARREVVSLDGSGHPIHRTRYHRVRPGDFERLDRWAA